MLKWQLILILVPSIIGTLSAALCNMKNSGSVIILSLPLYKYLELFGRHFTFVWESRGTRQMFRTKKKTKQ